MKLRGILLCGAAAVTTLAGSEATAQSSEGETIGEVVVTARRVEENIQAVPVSITVASGDRLEQANVKDIRDLQTITPGLSISIPPGDPTAGVISIRGQAQADTLLTTDGSTGVYVDGAYLPRGAGLRPILGNSEELARVEVLRGPQGTLFGRNTTGGALNIVTKGPGPEFGGYVTATGASHDFREVSAGINIPLGEGAGLRLAAQHSEDDGVGSDSLGRAHRAQEVDYLHGRLVLEPNESLIFDLSATYQDFNSSADSVKLFALCGLPGSGCSAAPVPGGSGTIAVLAGLGLPLVPTSFPTAIGTYASYLTNDPYTTGAAQSGPSSAEVVNLVGTLSYELSDMLTVKSITSYTEVQRTETLDLDGTPFDILSTDLPQNYTFYSQELQALWSGDRLDVVVGGYASRETGDDGSLQNALPAINPANPVITDGSVENTSLAVFGQFNYHINDRLTFTAGARYTKEGKQLVSRNHTGGAKAMGVVIPVIGPPLPGSTAGQTAPGTSCSVPYVDQDSPTACQATYDDNFSDVSWLFSLDYEVTDDTLLYAKVARGFRGGGQNLRGTATTGTFAAFEPEIAVQYEAGVKTTFWDGRARVNAAGWFTDYKDIQRSRIFATPSGGSGTQVSNAASAELYGGELEGTLIPIQNLTLTTALSYFHGEYKRWEDGNLDRTPTPFGFPKWTAYVGANYRVPLDFGQLALQLDYRWQDKSVLFVENSTPGVGACCTQQVDPTNTLYAGSYAVVNGRVTLRLDNVRAEVSLFGRNITNKHYIVGTVDLAPLGHRVVTYGEPRVIGVEVKKRF